eukprot:758537-Hanusia_phi.AAC.4
MAGKCVRLRETKPMRVRSLVACVLCRRSKVKCDEGRPCSRCKRLQKEHECEYADMELVALHDGKEEQLEIVLEQRKRHMEVLHVERPLDFWIRSLSFEKPSLLREQMNSMGWPDRVLARHWEFGFKSQELMNIFVSLPPHLQHVTRRALHAVEILIADKMAKQVREFDGQLLMGGETIMKPELELELDRAFYNQQSFGLCRQHLHPSTGKRAHVFASDTSCKLLGLHAEEMLARVANRELSLLSTEFTYLCYIMFGTWSFATRPGQPFELLLRLRNFHDEAGAGCTVTRIMQQQEFDCHGLVRTMKTFMVPVCSGRKGSRAEAGQVRADDTFVVQVEQKEFETCLSPLHSTHAMFSKHLSAKRDYEAWTSAFVSDLYAVRGEGRGRGRRVWEVEREGEGIGGRGEGKGGRGKLLQAHMKSKEGMERLHALADDLELMYQPLLERAEKILQEGNAQMPGD